VLRPGGFLVTVSGGAELEGSSRDLGQPGWVESIAAVPTVEAREVASGVWCWERRPRGLRPDEFGGRTSYAVSLDSDLLLVDPLVQGDEDPALEMLDELVRDRVRILVTMPYHTRSSELLWHRYRSAKARIYGHPAVRTRLEDTSGFEAVVGGTALAGLVRFHSLGQPPRSQQPIELPAVRALAFGDAIIETGGELRVWAALPEGGRRRQWWQEHYLPSLERLTNLDIEHVLVTHGQPAIGDGKAELRRAVQRPPWQRPKRIARSGPRPR